MYLTLILPGHLVTGPEHTTNDTYYYDDGQQPPPPSHAGRKSTPFGFDQLLSNWDDSWFRL